jgi:hypothetical protein
MKVYARITIINHLNLNNNESLEKKNNVTVKGFKEFIGI